MESMGNARKVDAGTLIAARVVDVVVLAPAVEGEYPDRWRILTLRRGSGTRCTGAWEIVHGHIEQGERPAQAAAREVKEETGMTPSRLYVLSVNPFYLPKPDTVELAIVYAAIVNASPTEEHSKSILLSHEHDAAQWRTASEATATLAWPREHEAVRYAMWLLRTGNAGNTEDVLLAR